MDSINKNFKIKKNLYPFPYIVIENFFEENFYRDLCLNFPKLDKFKEKISKVKRMDFDLSYGDEVYDNIINNNLSYKKLHSFVYSNQFPNFFLDLFKEEIEKEYKKKTYIKIFLNLKYLINLMK